MLTFLWYTATCPYFWIMNQFKYRWVLYFISSVILTTLFIQVYWNYKNYELGKQQLVNDVQTSLDNTVDQYYAQLAAGESIQRLQQLAEVYENIKYASKIIKTLSSLHLVILSRYVPCPSTYLHTNSTFDWTQIFIFLHMVTLEQLEHMPNISIFGYTC